MLRVEDGELDSERLERAVDGGDLRALTAALALWRGAPLSQFAYERFAHAEVARLEELRLAAVEARIDEELALGRHAQLIAELEALVHRHPSREWLQAQLMLALYRSGRQADALEAYRRAQRSLDADLGIEPGAQLRELERKILNQDESLAAPPAPVTDIVRALRRRSAALVGAAVVLAGVAAAAFLVTRDSAGGLSPVPSNRVGVIDPGRNEVTTAIPVGIRPGPIAAGRGAVWVGNVDDRSRIDPARRAAAATVSLDRRTPTGVSIGSGAAQVTEIPPTPSLEVVARDGFDWPDALVGAAAAAAVLATLAGVTVAARSRRLRHA